LAIVDVNFLAFFDLELTLAVQDNSVHEQGPQAFAKLGAL
jgi:hypothetical protein